MKIQSAVFAFILILLIISSCRPAGEGSEKEPEEDSVSNLLPSPDVSGIKSIEGCYTLIIHEDTAGLNLQVNGQQVMGDLYYKWKEKDRNEGTIRGVITDTVIRADYTFRSEGKTSVREVFFLIKGDSLIEGTGIVDASTDTVRFRSRNDVRFDNNLIFIRTKCVEE